MLQGILAHPGLWIARRWSYCVSISSLRSLPCCLGGAFCGFIIGWRRSRNLRNILSVTFFIHYAALRVWPGVAHRSCGKIKVSGREQVAECELGLPDKKNADVFHAKAGF